MTVYLPMLSVKAVTFRNSPCTLWKPQNCNVTVLENSHGARKCYKSPKFLMYFVLKYGISDLFFSLRHFIERIFNWSSQQPQPTTCRTTPSSGHQLMCQPLVPELLPAALVHPFLPFRDVLKGKGWPGQCSAAIGALFRAIACSFPCLLDRCRPLQLQRGLFTSPGYLQGKYPWMQGTEQLHGSPWLVPTSSPCSNTPHAGGLYPVI